MGTTTEKLTYLNTTKQNLKTVINTTGAGLTDESTFRSYANVLNDKIIGAINGDVDLFEEYPKVSGNGTDLSLNGVVEGKMSITPQGGSSQFSTTGKNLLNLPNGSVTHRGITGTISNDNILTYSGIATNVYANITDSTENQTLSAGTYTFSIDKPTANNERVVFYGFGKSVIIQGGQTFTTFTLNEETTSSYRVGLTNLTTDSSYSGTFKMQLEFSSTATSYEPYTGGIPAPNPDFPYMPSRVTGDNTINIVGKNLIDFEDIQYTISNAYYKDFDTGIVFTEDMVGKLFSVSYDIEIINYTGTLTSFFGVTGRSSNPSYMQAQLIAKQKNIASEVIKVKIENITIPNYVGQHLILRPAGFTSPITGTFKVTNVQMEWGTTVTDFVKHEEQNYPISLGNIELNSSPDGTIRDQIVGKPNEWYKREYIGKITDVSGSTSITINDMVSNGGFYSYYGGTLNDKTIMYASAISGTNTILYQKSQYTDIPITDTTLINQLNDIYNNAHSYNGVTNITTTYEDGNEQMYLDIEALKNVWEATE